MSQSQRDLDKFIIENAECELLKVLQEMLKSADVSDILSRDLVAMMPKDIKTSSKIRNSNIVLHGVDLYEHVGLPHVNDFTVHQVNFLAGLVKGVILSP